MLKSLFGKKKSDTDVVVISQTKPDACGGTDATLDKKAPKEIASEDMILFDVTSALNGDGAPGHVSAFAAPAGKGSFLFLSVGEGFRSRDEKKCAWALVKENVFPRLVELVRECSLAKKNGFHSETHGLPENYGGSVSVEYASGERISFSDNQSPVISDETGGKIADLFGRFMKGESISLPVLSDLKAIRFEEIRDNGGFTKALLSLNPDGTGINEKKSRYDDPKVYESAKTVEKETVDAIKKNIADTGILAWSDLPDGRFSFGGKKTLSFVFADGAEITVSDGKLLPSQISRGFFNIELEMTAKH